MNVAYTGHGLRWLWPQGTVWAQWSNPVLMMLFGIGGLLFAQRFLDTRRRFPRAHKAVLGYMSVGAALLRLAMLPGSRSGALQVALGFLFLFSLIMLFLGTVAVRGGRRAARYFLVAAFAAMVGTASTVLSMWGVVPYSAWSFRAVEMGMLADATLLALTLTYQFRLGQVLVAVAAVLKDHVRQQDVIVRWGGEEFLLLPETDLNMAAALADHLLYRSKSRGRDQVSYA